MHNISSYFYSIYFLVTFVYLNVYFHNEIMLGFRVSELSGVLKPRYTATPNYKHTIFNKALLKEVWKEQLHLIILIYHSLI